MSWYFLSCILKEFSATSFLIIIFQLLRWFGSRTRHQFVLAVIIAMAAVQGVKNIYDEQAILGEFSNIDMERLVEWITKNTKEGERSF